MATIHELEGPHLLRPNELRASQRLSDLCFDGGDFSFPPEESQIAEEAEPVLHSPRSGETYVISAPQGPVAQISIFTTPLRIYDSIVQVGSIGGVCTHPEYRGGGLATRLMEHCTQRLAQLGARLMVISGRRGLYLRLGNTPMGKFADFHLKPGFTLSNAPAIRLRPASAVEAALGSQIYQAEPVHFTRPIERFVGRFRPHEIGFQAEDWIVELDGQAVAYLLLSIPWDELDKPEPRPRYLFEYAGSRIATASALPLILEQFRLPEIQVPVPWQDVDLIHLLRASGTAPAWTTLPDHTIRVISFPGLMADLRAYARARLRPDLRRGLRFEQSGPLLGGSGEDRYTIRRGKDRLELDGAAMTRLIMGDPHGETLPTPGALAEIIAGLFPLPSFYTGMDYH